MTSIPQVSTQKPMQRLQGGLPLPGFKTLSSQTPNRSLSGKHQYTPYQLSPTEISARWEHVLKQPREEWLRVLKNANIIGFGGAGFPTAQKLAAASKAKTLILNAMECEPYITCDDRLIQEQANEILLGAALLCRLLPSIEQVIIGIEDNKPEALAALQKVQPSCFFNIPISLVSCPTLYPSGGEKQLIQLVLQQDVPQGAHPTDIGIVCQNVGTCYAIYERLLLNRQPTHRLTTLTGQAIPKAVRGNYWLPLGMTLHTLFSILKLELPSEQAVIMGGPIMGQPVQSLEQTISQTTQCILVPTATELPTQKPEAPCIRCADCAEVCPEQLLPQELHRHLTSNQLDQAKALNLDACIECRACDLVCPSHIPLVSTFQSGKQAIRFKDNAEIKALKAKKRFDTREKRLQNANCIKRTTKPKKASLEQYHEKNAAFKTPIAPTAITPTSTSTSSTPPTATPSTVIPSKTILKNQLKKAQKKWQDAENALNNARKQGKEVSHLESKVANLKNKAEIAKRALETFKQDNEI